MSSASGPSNGGQPAINNLPNVTTYLTGHDISTGKAVIQRTMPSAWQSFDQDNMAFHVVYTTSEFPADLNAEKDIRQHDQLMASEKLGLVNPNGVVCRMVDFAPGHDCMMHRTQSIDFGLVLEGEIELLLDSGETRLMKRGDVAVQRATMHAWRNPSEMEWARMYFVLQDCKKIHVAGRVLKEDLGRGTEGLPSSGNDV